MSVYESTHTSVDNSTVSSPINYIILAIGTQKIVEILSSAESIYIISDTGIVYMYLVFA